MHLRNHYPHNNNNQKMTVTISSLREKRHSLSPRIRSHSLSSLFTHRKDTPPPSEKPILRPIYTRVDTCDRLEVHHPSPTDVEFERKEARIHMSSPTSSPITDSPSRGRQTMHGQLWSGCTPESPSPTPTPTPKRGRERKHMNEQLWDGTLSQGLYTPNTHSPTTTHHHHWTQVPSTHQHFHTSPSPLDPHAQIHWPRFTGPDGRIYQVVPEEEKPRGRMPGRGYATVGPRDMPRRGNGVSFMGDDGRVYCVVPEEVERGRKRGGMPGMWVE